MRRALRLIVSVTLDGRSAGTWYAIETARRLQKRGHEILFLPRPAGKTIAMAREAGLKVIDNVDLEQKSFSRLFRHPRQLGRIAREFRPDIVLTHWGEDHTFWALAKSFGGVKAKLIRVRALDPKPPKKHPLSRWLHKRPTDHIVTVNHRLYDAYRMRLRIPEDKISIIGPGIDPSQFAGEQRADLAALGVPSGKRVIVLLARFSPVKGHRILLKAIPVVREKHPDTHYLWLGFPSEYDAAMFKRWFVEANVMDDVTVVDTMQTDLTAILRSCVIGVVSSTGSESVSRSLLEYLGCGIPAVATDVGGVPDLMSRGEFGVLVRPEDTNDLAMGIIRLLDRPDQGKSLGQNGRAYLLANQTWEHCIEQWDELLSRVGKIDT